MAVVKVPMMFEGAICYLQDTMVWAAMPDQNAVLLHLVTHSTPLPDINENTPAAAMLKAMLQQMLGEKQGDIVPARCSMVNVCDAFHLLPFNAWTGNGKTMPIGLQPGVIAAVTPAYESGNTKIIGSNLILMRALGPDDLHKVSVQETPDQVMKLLAVKPEDVVDLAGDFKGATHPTVIVSQ